MAFLSDPKRFILTASTRTRYILVGCFIFVAALFLSLLASQRKYTDPNYIRDGLLAANEVRILENWTLNLLHCVGSKCDYVGESDIPLMFPISEKIKAMVSSIQPRPNYAAVSHVLDDADKKWIESQRRGALIVLPKMVHIATQNLTFPERKQRGLGFGSTLNFPIEEGDFLKLEKLKIGIDFGQYDVFGPMLYQIALATDRSAATYSSLPELAIRAAQSGRQLEIGVPLLLSGIAMILDHSGVFHALSVLGVSRALRFYLSFDYELPTPTIPLRWHLGEGENSPAIPVADILLTLTNAATLWFLLIFLLRISHISLPKSVLWGTGAAIIFLTALGAYLDPEFTLRADLWSDSIGAALGVPIVLWGAKIHVARTEEFENDLEKEMEKTASISPMLYWFRVGLMVVTLLLTFAVNFSDIIRTEGAQFKEFLNWAHAALFPALIIASLLEIGSTTKKMRLFSKVMVDKALIDRDLLVGKEVQETLLPVRRGNNDAWAWRAFYYPAVSLAGDWFDIHKIKFSDDREFLLCCVADVTGHGIGAALITTTISSHWGIWLESISASPSPRTSEEKENFLIQAPATIHKGLCSLKRNAGCTAAFVLMDSEEKTMTFCTAGHPGIISHKPGDQKLGYHATSGTRLGFTGGEIKWEARTVPVLPGDSAYLFSDGIVPPGESVARWLKALQRTQAQGGPSLSVALLNAIRTNRSRFRQNRANEDDISLIILTSLG